MVYIILENPHCNTFKYPKKTSTGKFLWMLINGKFIHMKIEKQYLKGKKWVDPVYQYCFSSLLAMTLVILDVSVVLFISTFLYSSVILT